MFDGQWILRFEIRFLQVLFVAIQVIKYRLKQTVVITFEHWRKVPVGVDTEMTKVPVTVYLSIQGAKALRTNSQALQPTLSTTCRYEGGNEIVDPLLKGTIS
jgi:hypothetical protein